MDQGAQTVVSTARSELYAYLAFALVIAAFVVGSHVLIGSFERYYNSDLNACCTKRIADARSARSLSQIDFGTMRRAPGDTGLYPPVLRTTRSEKIVSIVFEGPKNILWGEPVICGTFEAAHRAGRFIGRLDEDETTPADFAGRWKSACWNAAATKAFLDSHAVRDAAAVRPGGVPVDPVPMTIPPPDAR